MFHFYTPWNRQKTENFPTASGGINMEHLREVVFKFCYDGGHYHIETNPLICYANRWSGFYMIETTIMK